MFTEEPLLDMLLFFVFMMLVWVGWCGLCLLIYKSMRKMFPNSNEIKSWGRAFPYLDM